MASRALCDLTPELQTKAQALLRSAEQIGLDLLIYCTFRSMEEQAKLYRNGRSLVQINQKIEQLHRDGRPDLAGLLAETEPQYGKKIITYAGPGESFHNYGLAFDAVPMVNGKPAWKVKANLTLWKQYGRLVEAQGLAWSGRWQKLREYPHAQLGDMTLQSLLEFGQ